jgi:hypothetical protein
MKKLVGSGALFALSVLCAIGLLSSLSSPAKAALCHSPISCDTECLNDPIQGFKTRCSEVNKRAKRCESGNGVDAGGNCGKLYAEDGSSGVCSIEMNNIPCGGASYANGACSG